MKALLIVLGCTALALVLSGIERLRLFNKEKDCIRTEDSDSIKESLRKYRGLMD